jgi:hypothetical protein
MPGKKCDLLIWGGGTGGTAAAMAACEQGLRTVMVEETHWVGGQLTAQAVPPDEHPWIEQFGCTARYRRYREGVREYYRRHVPLTATARNDRRLNPGGGWVSALCHDPSIGHAVLRDMLAEPIARELLDLRLFSRVMAVEAKAGRIRRVEIENRLTGRRFTVEPRLVLDATELGDGIAAAGLPYVTGAESRRDTGEPHAPEEAQPANWQAFTWVFALAYDPRRREQSIPRPETYDFWRAYQPSFWPGPFLALQDLHPHTNQPRDIPMFSGRGISWFGYRQVVDPAYWTTPVHAATIVNWPMNDYLEGLAIGEGAEAAREGARQLSLSLLYWLQTEAGFPGLYPAGHLTGTDDGFAKTPYYRESRRIRALRTIVEADVASALNPGLTVAPPMPRSVGVGCYRIDLHPSTGGDAYIDIGALPFQIPAEALVPEADTNVLPAAKNIGTTHITNGCYRLHPVEWNIGEAAATLAAESIATRRPVRDLVTTDDGFAGVRQRLRAQGVETEWPELRPV